MRKSHHFFHPFVTNTLYHYTGIGSLMGIVDNQSIWASHVYYLNDSDEIIYACQILNKVLTQEINKYSGEEKIFLEQLVEWIDTFKSSPYNLFVFSLTEEKNQLSQWRSYTPHGKGVSLGFHQK